MFAGNSPNIDDGSAILAQQLSAGAGGRAGGEDVVDQNNAGVREWFGAWNANARFTFAARSARVRRVWVDVGSTRLRKRVFMGMPVAWLR